MPDVDSAPPRSPHETPDLSARQRIAWEIDIPTGVATWVLSAHAITLASPVVVLWVMYRQHAVLEEVLATPFLVYVGAALFLVGSAFEIAQNTIDRWFYEGPYPAFSDLLFNAFIAFGLGALALAASPSPWLVAVVLLAMAAFPALYLSDRVPYPAMGVVGLAAVWSLYDALGTPVIALLLVFSTGLNLYFLELIIRTKAQSLHGAIALSNGIGMGVVAFALYEATSPPPTDWATTLLAIVGVGIVAAVAWRPLSSLAPTRRRSPRQMAAGVQSSVESSDSPARSAGIGRPTSS